MRVLLHDGDEVTQFERDLPDNLVEMTSDIEIDDVLYNLVGIADGTAHYKRVRFYG